MLVGFGRSSHSVRSVRSVRLERDARMVHHLEKKHEQRRIFQTTVAWHRPERDRLADRFGRGPFGD